MYDCRKCSILKLLIIEKIYYVVYGDSPYILNFSVNQKCFRK